MNQRNALKASDQSTNELKPGNPKNFLDSPLVSIIIPCYNGTDFIEEAIASSLAQDYQNIEIIVVDDGSADDSADKISRYPVRYFHAHHEGVSAARNRGVRECGGEYIIFLDSDDRLLPHTVSVGVSILADYPEHCMAVGAHHIISRSGEFISRRDKMFATTDHYAHFLKSNFIECTSSAILRRHIAARVGWFDTALQAAEDYDFYLRLAREYPIICHTHVVTEYRLHQKNASHKSALMLTTTLRVVRAQLPYAFSSFERTCSYMHGSWLWRRKYGRQLTRELATTRAVGTSRRLKQWIALLTAYPIGIVIAIIGRILPRNITSSMFRHASHSSLSN
jgi:glycosyltransferase involved in cell wall biosynthesis